MKVVSAHLWLLRTRLWRRRAHVMPLLLAAASTVGCGPKSSPPKAASPVAESSKPRSAVTKRAEIETDPDPSGLDEGLADALLALQDKFKCNRIAGCAPHEKIVGYGWRATKPVQHQFIRARRRDKWRSRLVLIAAELRDPSALPFLIAQTRDADDAVVAYALYGIALLRSSLALDKMRQFASAGVGMQWAMSRLASRWALHELGETATGDQFKSELRDRSGQLLAAGAIAWGIRLCGDSRVMECTDVLHAAARHPGFVARRAALRHYETHLNRAAIPTLVMLAADPITSLSRGARALLVQLTGRADLQDGAAWRQWCDRAQCDALPPRDG